MAIAEESEVLLELGLATSSTNQEQAVVVAALKRAHGAIIRHLKYDPEQKAHTEYYPQVSFTQRDVHTDIWDVEGNSAVLERLASSATDELQLRHLPVRASTAIQIFVDSDGRAGTTAGSFASDTEKTEGTDFWVNYDGNDASGNRYASDGIVYSFGRWPITPGSIKVIYTAGYTAAEFKGTDTTQILDATPIWEAVVDEAVRRAKKAFLQWKTNAGFLAGPLESERLGDYSYKVNTAAMNRLFGGNYDLLPETQEKLRDFINYGVALAS